MKKKSQKAEKTIVIDIVKLISVLLIIAMCVLLVISAVRYVKSLMRVSGFEIIGDSPYDREDIVNATGIKLGDKLYAIEYDDIEKKIMTECPYINEVEIKSVFPNTVKIKVSSLSASWYVKIVDDYYALDADLRVLEETTDNKKFINGNVPFLGLPNIKNSVVGSTLTFGESESEIKYANEIMDMIKSTTFKSRLTAVNIENRFDIYIQVDGKIDAYMGDTSKFEAKLNALQRVLNDSRLQGCVSAKIDLSNPENIAVSPVYDYSTTQEETTAEG